MSAPVAHVVESYTGGYWRILARPPGGTWKNITRVRGVPTQVGQMTTKDPFGPAAASLTFPGVTYLEGLGVGELAWCRPSFDVDICWVVGDPEEDVESEVISRWEGYHVSTDYNEDGALTTALAGAMMQMDNYLAKPEYLYRPLPYEQAIARQFEGHPDLRLAPLTGLDYGDQVTLTAFNHTTEAMKEYTSAKVDRQLGTGKPTAVVTAADHGFARGNVVRVYGSQCRKGKTNNGLHVVVGVISEDKFIIALNGGGYGKDVIRPGFARLRKPTMFPPNWAVRFNRHDTARYPTGKPWLVPSDIAHNQLWTGMLTRSTGAFEPALSNYIQGLLANMHTPRGQFTLLLEEGRVPYLTHRTHLHTPGPRTLVVEALWPGVRFSGLSRDFTQRVGVVYAQGKASNGDAYTGMQVTADGSATWYDPAAYRREVHPVQSNPLLDKRVMRKEVMVSYPDGLDEDDATKAAVDHLQRFSDPGFTGTLVLDVDPIRNGVPFPRQAIVAGMTVQVRGLFGRSDGLLFHITEASMNAEAKVSLTLDTSYRDHITVDQVRKRGRDSLVPYRVLSTSGQYDPKIPDLLYPWSYAKGAGVMPFGAATLFTKKGPAAVPRGSVSGMFDVPFPWTEYTTRYPPRNNADFYMRVRPADHYNASNNWANAKNKPSGSGLFEAHKVLLAAAGEIKLFQIAAYDRDGNVKAVPFHVSLHLASGITPFDMPRIPLVHLRPVTSQAKVVQVEGEVDVTVSNLPKNHGFNVSDQIGMLSGVKGAYINGDATVTGLSGTTGLVVTMGADGAVDSGAPKDKTWTKVTINDKQPPTDVAHHYDVGQPYPFFNGAFERLLPNGQVTQDPNVFVSSGQQVLAGYGTAYEQAGFWPGSGGLRDAERATGMFSDESGFGFDFRTVPSSGVDARHTPKWNQRTSKSVTAYVMIYCDADPNDPTYFLGRCFRKEYLAT